MGLIKHLKRLKVGAVGSTCFSFPFAECCCVVMSTIKNQQGKCAKRNSKLMG